MMRKRSRSPEVAEMGTGQPGLWERRKKQYGRASSLCGKKKSVDGTETSPRPPPSPVRGRIFTALSRVMEDYTQWYWQEEGRTPFPFPAVKSMHLEAMFRQQRTDPVTLSFTHAPWKDVTITKDTITLMGRSRGCVGTNP